MGKCPGVRALPDSSEFVVGLMCARGLWVARALDIIRGAAGARAFRILHTTLRMPDFAWAALKQRSRVGVRDW